MAQPTKEELEQYRNEVSAFSDSLGTYVSEYDEFSENPSAPRPPTPPPGYSILTGEEERLAGDDDCKDKKDKKK